MAVSLDSFLEAHPWPAEWRAKGTPMEYLWRFEMTHPPGEVWPYVIETSRFNRALGLSKMEFEEREGIKCGTSKNAGVTQEWIELPWDWVSEKTLTSVRLFSRGLAHTARVVYLLEPTDTGTAFHVYFGWIPRGLLGRFLLWAGMPWMYRQYARVLADMDTEIGVPPAEMKSLQMAAPALSADARSRVESLKNELLRRGVAEAPLDRLIEHIATGDETELYRIQVKPLARRWGVNERDLLVACLHATRLGLLELSWDVICPHCRGVRFEANTLGDVPSAESCEVCAIQFEADSDQAIEITFHVHPSIRVVPRVFFCSAEPSTKLHIQVQRAVPAGGTARLDTALAPGRYRARLHGSKDYRYITVGEGGEPAIELRSDGDGDLDAAPRPELRLVNRDSEPQTFIVENVAWSDDALRPSRVFNMAEFRDLFSEEYLGSDIQLSVGEQTILFTDMVGSTEFYGTRGDPEAFMEVRRHFTEVYDIVRQRNGCVVKTIGDAAMAAFTNPVDAVAAAADIMRCFRPGRDDTSIILRASVNTGPCIAVNLNSGIDYFGGTVNIASKLQANAGGGQIAFSLETYDAPGVADMLRDAGADLETSTLEHAALPQPIPVYVWDVHAESAGPLRGSAAAREQREA